MIFDVFVPVLPAGINMQYRCMLSPCTQGPGYKAAPHAKWAAQAALLIGARVEELDWRDEAQEYTIKATLFNSCLNVDASVKIVVDTVTEKLGFDARRVRELHVRKAVGTGDGVMIILKPFDEG